jgi:protein-arginine deiminase
MAVESNHTGIHYAVLQNTSPSGKVIEELRVELYVFHLALDIDANRDGEVSLNEAGKANWVWGRGHPGAIVLVNNDRDRSDVAPAQREFSELADLIIRPTEVDPAPTNVELVLYATSDDASRFSIYRKDGQRLQRILGKAPSDDGMPPITVSPPLSHRGEHCYIEAHEYPGPFFEGLLTVELQLRRSSAAVNELIVSRDRVVCRVSPWIMTPNTLPVERVYACDMSTNEVPNSEFLSGIKKACKELQVPLKIIPPTRQGETPMTNMTVGFRMR